MLDLKDTIAELRDPLSVDIEPDDRKAGAHRRYALENCYARPSDTLDSHFVTGCYEN